MDPLAARAAPRRRTQLLVLVKGLPGSGKSTLAKELAGALQCPLVDKDDARDCFQEHVHAAPSVDWNALSYTVMFRFAARQLGLGLSVVLDCPFARRELYDRACALAQGVHATGGQDGVNGDAAPCVRVVVVDVECGDGAVWRQRLEARGAQDRGTEREHKPGAWDGLQATIRRYGGSWQWSTDGSTPLPHHVRVDTACRSTAECTAHVLAYLEKLEG